MEELRPGNKLESRELIGMSASVRSAVRDEGSVPWWATTMELRWVASYPTYPKEEISLATSQRPVVDEDTHRTVSWFRHLHFHTS
jgi:hypothetical protein